MGIWSEFAEEGLMSIKNTKPQKSRDAKRYVLTSRARNKQLGLIKKSSKKSKYKGPVGLCLSILTSINF